MRRLLGADLTAVACIAGGALVGGLATAALADGGEPVDRSVATTADLACAAEGVTPRVVVVGGSDARVVVAPNVRIGAGSTCEEHGPREIRIYTGPDGAEVARVRMDVTRAREAQGLLRVQRQKEMRQRIEQAQERAAQARERAAEAREHAAQARERAERARGLAEGLSVAELDGVETAQRILESRLRLLEETGLEDTERLRRELERLSETLGQELSDEIRAQMVQDMRRLREELDRARRERGGN